MRILWFKPILPYPPTSGTRRVTLQILQHLVGHHEIVLFTRLLHESERRYVSDLESAVPGLRVQAVLTPNKRSTLHRLAYRFITRWWGLKGVPPVQSYTCLPELIQKWQRAAADFRPDLAVAEYWYSMPYLDGLAGVTKVMFAHDIDYQVQERAGYLPRDTGRGARWAAAETRLERDALSRSQNTWFLTRGDMTVAELGGNGGAAVMPYGLDLSGELSPRREHDPAENPMDVLLFGSFHADFNRDALDFTLEEVWPEIKKLQPQARLRVAGDGLSEALMSRCKKAGVTLQGRVDNVREAYLTAAVILIPLRFGGGLRIRLLEALALECAVVGTTVGVLGMGPESESELLAADSSRALAGQVVRLLEDPALRRRLGKAGRRCVKSAHDLQIAAEEQRRLVRELVAK